MALFPITDLVREDDIRMRRKRAIYLFAGMIAVPWMLFGGQAHHDDQRSFRHRIVIDGHVLGRQDDMISGNETPRLPPIPAIPAIPELAGLASLPGFLSSHALPQPDPDGPTRSLAAATLTVDLPCANSVTLLPRADMGDRILVSTRRGQDEALRLMVLKDGIASQPDSCSDDASGDFILQMAPDKMLRIRQSNDVDIRGGRFAGPVTIDGSGNGSVMFEATGALTTRQQASGDVFVGTVSGAVDATLDGSGDLRVADGQVPRLSAVIHSSGDLSMGRAAIGGGQLSVNSSGDFSADRVTGHFDGRTSSSGDITINSVVADTVQLEGQGSGDITIRHGRIGTLTAERHGSGDLVVDAPIENAIVSHQGSGDVRLPRASRTVGGTDGDRKD